MSIIDQGLVVTGDIVGEDDVTIKGVVKGSIILQKGSLNVEQVGHVEGEIVANKVMIAGEVLGNISAITSLHVLSTAKVLGTIRATEVAIADGAVFSGKLEIEQVELSEMEVHDRRMSTVPQ